MNPWNSLLEALHSALIDEIVERHPEPKPELGMPFRQSGLSLPSNLCSGLFGSKTMLKDRSGYAVIAFEPGVGEKLKLSEESLFSALLARATQEFELRRIQPQLSSPGKIQLPLGERLSLVIWIPIRLAGPACFLGVGVT